MFGGRPEPAGSGENHTGKRNWSTTITRMFGRAGAGVGARARVALVRAWVAEPVLGGVLESLSAAAAIAAAAPARAPPATSPAFRNVRRSTFLCSFGSMPSMRALILGPAVALGLGFSAHAAAAAQA